jgi:hypothetical protein
MEITTTPDIYAPTMDDSGNYVDYIPIIKNGIYCECSLKENPFDKKQFRQHIKNKSHQKWLFQQNQNKDNHLMELIKHRETVKNQQSIIKNLETQLQTKIFTIDYLTNQITTLMNQKITNTDLLDIN